MTEYEPSIHPVGFVRQLEALYGSDLTLSFSRYFYRPQSLFDERECFDISIEEVTGDWVTKQYENLQPGWELAINSKAIDRRGRTRHIGMIDFIGRLEMSVVSSRVRNLLGARASSRASYYDSGRSVHAYIADLMGPSEWHEFLGRLLLMNAPNEEPVVDARWIGHRLLGGYAALRWTANSKHYTQVPMIWNK